MVTMKRLNNRSNAFTLVEMLVVLGMISILMGVTFTGVGKARTQARIVKANAEVRELMNAWLAYEASYNDWPSAITEGRDMPAVKENLLPLLGLGGSGSDEVFLNAQLVNNAFRDPWGNPYRFRILPLTGSSNTSVDEFGISISFPNRNRPVLP